MSPPYCNENFVQLNHQSVLGGNAITIPLTGKCEMSKDSRSTRKENDDTHTDMYPKRDLTATDLTVIWNIT